MSSLQEILRDPNYINANEATKRAIFERHAPLDQNYTGANDATQAAIRQRFGIGQMGMPVAAPEQPTTGAFAAGVKSYLPQVQETFGGLKTLLGVGAERVLGEGAISKGLIESGAASMAEAEKARAPLMTKERGSFTDALDKGVGSVLTEWLPFQAGAGAAQVLEALALVGAGGLAGTMTAPGPGTLAGAGTGLVARELAKRGVKESAEKILKERGEDAAKVYFEKAAKDVALDIGKKRGQTAALAGQAAFYGTGQTTSRAVEEAEKLGGTATDIELARVLPAAAVSTVAEFIGDKIALGALKGIKPGEPGKFVAADLAKNILLNIGLTGTKEVPVEVIQSAAERFGAKLSLTDAQALKEYIDATAASYGMAVGPGVGGGVRQTMAERAKKPEAPAPKATPAAPPVAPEAEVPPAVEQPVAETPPVEPPVTPPVAETPPVEPPTAEPPVAETPPAEAPPVAQPATPVAEVPAVETPVTPVAETPPVVGKTAVPAAPEVEPPIKAIDIDRAWRDLSGRNKLSDFDEKAPTDVSGDPEEFVLSRTQGNQYVSLAVREQTRDDGAKVFSSSLETGGKGFPTGTGAATTMYLEALNIAKNRNIGWMSEGVRSDQSRAIYERLKKAGVPFVEDGNASYIDSQSLASVNLQEVANKLAQQQKKTPTTSVPAAPVVEEPTVETPAAEPVAQPKTLEEFRERMPLVFDNAEVRAANNAGDFAKLTKALQRSSNPAIRRIGQLGGGIASKITLKKPGRLGGRAAGRFTYDDDAIQMIPSYAGDEHTNAHETLHALIARAQRTPTEKQRPVVQQIDKLYEHVKRELKKKGITVQQAYGLKNAREFTAEAMTNPEFQFELMQIPYPGKKSSWTQFVKLIADLLGIQNTNALTEVMNLVDRLATQKQPRKTVTDKGLTDEMAIEEAEPTAKATPTVSKAAAPTGTPGQQALETINRMGMGVKPPEPGTFKKIQKALTDAGENPEGTKESAKKALIKFGDWFETTVFSGDAAWSNTIHRSVIKDMKKNEEVLGKLLEIRQSQTVNADNVVSRGLIEGTIEYDDETKKHQSVKKEENFAALAKKLDELATKYGLTKEQMERIAHTYLVAKRLPGIIKRNEELDAEIKAEEATAKPDRKSIDKWKSLKVFVSPQQEAMVEPGLSLLKDIPELSQIPKMINEIRKNHITFMVDSGLWSAEYAQAMWDNIDWVPFYREEQLEADAGPQEVIRGLQVKSKEFQMKGSEAAVNDVFENMMLWSQYAMNRGIRADKARRMIDVAKDIDVGDRKMAVQVTEEKRGMNIVRIYRDGKQELWDVEDPMFMDAFASIQNVSMPMFKWAAKMANILRNSVVLYPLFSVAQVPQDSFAAMYTSGLKPQYALRIPILAVKEFIKTLNKTSATHNELVKYGVVGARTFNAEVMRKDAEIFAGLKPPKGGWNKTKDFLEHIAMSADNAVRQAVYEAARQQGVSKAEALEKAFEIFNVRRRGTSKALNLAGQTIPFFYAYLAAQRVAYRTITGVGTSPTERKAALQTLAATSAAVFTLSMLYAMMVSDDEDYAETPAAVRDRTLTIPGTGGVRIPLRADFFLFPKIIAEHTYLMLTDQGYEDGAKFRRSMRDGLINAIASPTPLPQIAKPALEVVINYSFFDGKPVIGTFEKQKDLERQFNDSTSEFSKLLGKTGFVSPIAADHLIRGMLGSAGGLALYGTNMFLHSDPDVPRPEMSWKEAAAALPGTSGFLKRPQESALKNDFFILRDEVEKAVNTFNDIKTRSPEGIEAFLADEKKMARLMLGKPVDKINRELSKIRKVITQMTNMPENQMSAEEKSDNIRQLRELEREILRSVNVKELREMAKI